MPGKSETPDERQTSVSARSILGVVLLVVGFGVAVVVGVMQRETRPDSHPPLEAGQQEKAVARLAEVDPEELAALAALLEEPDAEARRSAVRTLARLGAPAAPFLAGALRSSDLEVQRLAQQALTALGPEAQAAIPTLAAILHEPWTPAPLPPGGTPTIIDAAGVLHGPDGEPIRRSLDPRDPALSLLARMGPVAIPALGRALSETEPELTWRAAKLLIGLGPPGRDEVLRALGFESDPRRQRALLDSLHPWQSPTLVPVLIRILATPDRTSLDAARLRSRAISRLRAHGPMAREAIPALLEILDTPRSTERQSAARALGAIGDAEVLPPLLDALERYPSAGVRRSIAEGIGALGPVAAPSVPRLIQLFREQPEVRGAVATALGRIGAPARPAVPLLLEFARDLSTRDRHAAISALGSIGRTEEVLPTLLAVVAEDPSDSMRERALVSIAQRGPSAEPAIPALARALEGASGTVGPKVVRALEAIGPASIPVLETALDSRHHQWVRRDARKALETLRSVGRSGASDPRGPRAAPGSPSSPRAGARGRA